MGPSLVMPPGSSTLTPYWLHSSQQRRRFALGHCYPHSYRTSRALPSAPAVKLIQRPWTPTLRLDANVPISALDLPARAIAVPEEAKVQRRGAYGYAA
jgi:hypothetical protein